MSKVTVVGAGNVGATCANVLAVKKDRHQRRRCRRQGNGHYANRSIVGL